MKNWKLFGKRLIGIILSIGLFLGFVYLYTGGKDVWLTILGMFILLIFIGIIAGIVKIIMWAFDL